MQITNHLYLVGSEQFGISHLLDCNCYLIDGGDSLVLVDTGTGLGTDDILENIGRAGFDSKQLTHILLTHAHLGHWGGAPRLRHETGAEVWAPADGRYWMEHLEEDITIEQNFKFGRYPSNLQPQPCPPDHTFSDGDQIQLGKLQLQAIGVKGHTKDSTVFVGEMDGRRFMLTGDVVFYAGSLGITNAPGSSLEDYRNEMPKLANQGVDILLPGHSVFILRNGQKHIDRALRKLADFVLPDTFFEDNEFMWEKDYLSSLQNEPSD